MKSSGRVSVRADGRTNVELTLGSGRIAREGRGGMVVVSTRAGDSWVSSLTLRVLLADLELGDAPVLLQGSSCAVRYRQSGARSEVDMGLVEAHAKVLGAGGGKHNIEIEAHCKKQLSTTQKGAPLAPAIPEAITVVVHGWLSDAA